METRTATQIARRLSAAQRKAIVCSQIGTADTRSSTCCSLRGLGLYRFAGGGDYCGQTRGGKSLYNEMIFVRTDLGDEVAAIVRSA